ncbi:hypothetical protein GUITHDRAFT_153095 [Guillardia theta CCMP2712]|uniref:Uncharacterized protein n=2 Tax=Guillardia theta TaxID=55529 RepID=L1J5T4_GUITC|nr:hypothetical protein GUITHDRAFT_153095 [Guillardia theta CCMP2712]EKX43893.1 hypothetical protein GUITHDRAFT_153095 [Guillardia theta CCMP2712]|eukprot:XP_005830873.1 hypothetical protein GUITHDRAFT_153095 [Guillardia theta CCMP2712]
MYRGAGVLALASLSLFAVLVIEHHSSSALVERIPDTGEDYFSAIEPPHRPYEWPWLKDKKFSDRVRPLGYEPSDAWNGEPQWYSGYVRTQYDEFGDRAYDVNMRPAQDCYDEDHDDCYRERFDEQTGYLRAEDSGEPEE